MTSRPSVLAATLALLVSSLLPRAPGVAAQSLDAVRPAQGATLSGVTYDSLAAAPLARATVQLASADDPIGFSRSTLSDSLGRFTLTDVPDGRYTLGFLHPVLDSLGVDAPVRAVSVSGGGTVRVDLAIPSPARLRAALCGARAEPDDGAVIVGVVRAAEDATPAGGVAVTAQWLELSFTRQGLRRRAPSRSTTTTASGWFALCDVPRAGTTTLLATRGSDSTALVEVQVPADGFARRTLYLGRARTSAIGDGTQSAEALAGTVVDAASGRPLAGAQVRLAGGPETRSNAQGEWTLPHAALGTRMLEARAVGYYPERRPVDVIVGATPVHLALPTLQSVLDTVRVTATATATSLSRARAGFEERRRSTGGRFLSAVDVARRGPTSASQLFLSMDGIRLGFANDTLATEADLNVKIEEGRRPEPRILMRGGAQRLWCTASIYIDGLFFPDMSTEDIDDVVAPARIAGIEIYSYATVPAQFAQSTSACGSIVIWRR